MAGNIKGITIKLDGDTGSLTSDIREADSNLKSLESQLKAVDKALKLDPSNVELISQKQELLNSAIEQTKAKLEAEQAAAEQAAQALEEGTITQQEYDALQTEIQNTSNKLKELENAAKECSSTMGQQFEAVGEKIQDVGKKVEDVGKNLSTNVTAPIVGAGGAMMAAFVEVDSGLDKIAAGTGATGQALENLQDIALDLAVEIPSSFDDAGNAVAAVNTRFGVADSALKDLSGRFLMLSRITGEDVTSSINGTQTALASFNLDASAADGYLDALLATSQRSGASISELNNLVAANASTFIDMGLSIDDALAFLGELELSGADSTAVMGGLRRALADAVAEGIPLSDSLATLQNDMANAANSAEATQMAIDLFGNKSGPVIARLAQQGKLDFTTLSNAAVDYSGTLDTTYQNVASSTDDMKGSINEVKEAGAEFGEAVSGNLAPILSSLADELSDLSDWWGTLDSDTQNAIVKAALIVAAIGPVITIIGILIGSVGNIISSIGALTTFITGTLIPAFGSMSSFITASVLPVIIELAPVILAVVAAVAAVVAIIEAVKSVIENADAWIWGFQELWEGLKETFQSVWDKVCEVKDGIVETVGGLVDEVVEFFTSFDAFAWGKDLLDGFIDGLRSMWSSFTGAVSDIAQYIKDNLGFSEPVDGPLSGPRGFHTFAPDMIDLWNEGIYDNLDEVQRSAQDMAGTMASGLQSGLDYTGPLNNISGQLANLGNGSDRVINLYMGNDRLGTAIARNNQRAAYISGGRA